MSRDEKRFLVGLCFLLLVAGIVLAVVSLVMGDWTPIQAYATVLGICGGVLGLMLLTAWVAKKVVP